MVDIYGCAKPVGSGSLTRNQIEFPISDAVQKADPLGLSESKLGAALVLGVPHRDLVIQKRHFNTAVVGTVRAPVPDDTGRLGHSVSPEKAARTERRWRRMMTMTRHLVNWSRTSSEIQTSVQPIQVATP
jgi:hypothetical protein